MNGILKGWMAANVSVFLFFSGHLVSLLMHKPFLWRLYPIYNNLMYWSIQAEDWGGVSIMWKSKK